MIILQTLLAFFVVLGTLIIVHELGHYWVARWCGVKVLRFSVGMGKVIFSRRIGPDQTEWALSILPFGGYVKMLDAREQDVKDCPAEDLKREFTRQTVWRRIAIVAAGPIANFLLAIFLFSALYMYGVSEPVAKIGTVPENSASYKAGLRGGELITAVNGESIQIWTDLRWKLLQLAVDKTSAEITFQKQNSTSNEAPRTAIVSMEGLSLKDLEGDFLGKLGIDLARPKVILGQVAPNGPAQQAGLLEGDLILEINGVPMHDAQAFVAVVRASPAKLLKLRVLRKQQELDVEVTPVAQAKNGLTYGQIKVALAPMPPEMIIAQSSPGAALSKATVRTWDTSILTLRMLGKMIVGEVSWKNITGPITIADYAGKTARIGLVSFLSYIALISISLGVMNLLPIPVLDGGLLLYYSLEVVTGKPLSEKFTEIAQRAGVGILMMLMAVAIFNDIARHMP